MTTDQLVAYYVNLLIIQYKALPKAQATIAAISSTIVADQIVAQVRDGFDPATAVGAQLDILGQYVGAPREIPGFTPVNEYWALPSYNDPNTGYSGWARYTDVVIPSNYWRSYTTTDATLTLTDGQMRSLILYLVALHASDHSNESIDNLFAQFFGGYATVTDNGNMTVTYTHDATHDPSILFQIVNFIGALPHPAGVAIDVVEI
jgi:hypothetical protein